MPSCPNCGAVIPEDASFCGNCKTALTATATGSTTVNTSSSVYTRARLEKAMRHMELLSYAVAGLGLAILATIILIAFL
jgi:uncharacterized membrane protein YvbJ